MSKLPSHNELKCKWGFDIFNYLLLSATEKDLARSNALICLIWIAIKTQNISFKER